MPLQWLYEAAVNGASDDISSRVRLYTADLVQNAEELSTAISQITVDDPSGNYDIVGWRRIRVHETLATGSNSLVANLWVADRTVVRMDPEVSAARKWLVSVVDMNAVPRMRVMTTTTANRPAETDVARINWLLGTNEMSRVTVSEFVNSASPVQMDANDYTGQTAEDVINDCAQDSGKNYFVYTKQTSPSLSLGLWYDFTASSSYTSSLRLSNVNTDVDNVLTFFISDDTQLVRDPSRVFSGAHVRYKNGTVYEEKTLTSNTYTRRDAVYDAPNVNTEAGARRRARRYLADSSTEEDRITAAFYCPSEKVNWVREGMRVQIKATHLPGYESFTYQRVLKRTVKQISEANNATDPGYLVTLELSANPGTATCGDVGFTQISPVSFGASATVLPAGPTKCLQVWVQQVRQTPPNVQQTSPPGFTTANWAYTTGGGNNGNIAIAYRITQPGDTGNIPDYGLGGDRAHVLLEFAGVNALSDSTYASDAPNAASITTGTVTPNSGLPTVLVGAFIKSDSGIPGGNSLPNLGISAPATAAFSPEVGTLASHDQGPTMIVGYRIIANAAGSYTMTATGDSTGFATGPWGYVLAAFTG